MLASTVLTVGAAAHAQNAEEEASAAAVEQMVVTGSRIARDVLNTPAPVNIITAEDIQASGEIDIASVLREIPALNSSLTGEQSTDSAAPNGVGLADLRALGTERTLVLVNGRRHVAGVSGTAAVDITTIPTALIERVDVLTGGASSVYGADAVSGVVNFILKDDFEGFDLRSQFGISDRGDAQEYFVSGATGFNFKEGRGNTVLAIEYQHTQPLRNSQRPFTGAGLAQLLPNSSEAAAFLGLDPEAQNIFATNAVLPISSPLGIIFLEDANDRRLPGFSATILDEIDPATGMPPTVGSQGFPIAQVFDGQQLRPYDTGLLIDLFNGIGGDGIPPVENNEFVRPDQDVININANTNYEFFPWLKFFAETKFAYTNTFDETGVNGFNDDIPIALDNPFIPDPLRAQIDTLIGEGITPSIVISRDTLDVTAAPQLESDRYTFRIVGGFEGDLPAGFEYTASYNFGRTEVFNNEINTRIEDRFFASVDAVRDPATGNIVCRSDIDPNATPPVAPFPDVRQGFLTFSPGDGQCVPTSLFGPNAINQEAADFIFLDATSRVQLTQKVVNATIVGDSAEFFTIPTGGPIGVAFGFEYREELSDFRPNEFDSAGVSFNSVTTAALPESGGFEVYEGFFEANVPIVRDHKFLKEFSFDGSFRVSDYSTVGSTVAWGVGGVLRPTEDLGLRGTFSKAVRAPNVTELFSPQQPIFLDADADPCNPNLIDAGSEFREQNCLDLVGPGFNSTDFLSAFITGRAGGNPDLQEERATIITGGVTITPRWLPELLITADFFDIEIEDAIDLVDAETIVENCVDAPSLNNSFCDLIERDPQFGFITFFTSGQANVASQQARGVEFQVRYDLDLNRFGLIDGDIGEMQFATLGTRNLRRIDFPFQDFPEQADDVLTEFSVPKWIVNFNATYRLDRLRVGWQGRFQSSQLSPGIEVDPFEENPDLNFADPQMTGSAFVHDFDVSYQVLEGFEVYGGINNALDRDPFVGAVTRPVGVLGRYFFFGFTYRG